MIIIVRNISSLLIVGHTSILMILLQTTLQNCMFLPLHTGLNLTQMDNTGKAQTLEGH